MSNHPHALVQVADLPLEKTMQRIAMRYARHRHKSWAGAKIEAESARTGLRFRFR
jgi:hypothetical protein